ncbi:MAG TPA: DUF1761 domain-containing protein [Verrucomicrobiae bacterium]|nr:DUF1761 domain-containing protein [Verrucomicrobiae bacterium]
MDVQINYLAVLLAAISSMIIGAGWYAGPVFGDAWMKMVKLDKDKAQQGATVALVGAFLLALVTATTLYYVAILLQHFYLDTFFSSALRAAFLLWVGIMVPTVIMHGLFERRRKKLMALTVAHEFVAIMIMGLVIGIIGF